MSEEPARRPVPLLMHDLNNALMTVLVNTEFLATASQVPQLRMDAHEAFSAAQRAAAIVKELNVVLRDSA